MNEAADHAEPTGMNSAWAVAGAILISVLLVSVTHWLFNSSAEATEARNISKMHLEQRKLRLRTQGTVVDPNLVTTETIDKAANKIDQTVRSVDQGGSQLTADDLSDKALGID